MFLRLVSRSYLLPACALLLFPVGPWQLTELSAEVNDNPVDFASQVLPILSDRCALCHGPDEASREADLRLDLESAVSRPTENGGHDLVIAPGKPDQSELIRRIMTDDESEQMPPPDSKLSLTTEEIDLLKRWIEQGANWEQHWSFRQLSKPTIPASQGWTASTGIDSFLNHRLQLHSLPPSPQASRYQLIRRLTLDLTGLPPTAEEVQRFVDSEDPAAYAKLVNRLMADPAHGERMAVPWLDAARYADTYGYQADVYRDVWPWRDWVIDAFRQGMPYDQFLRWQIAGDLIEDPTRDSRLATTFNRLHRQTNEGGSVEEEFRQEYIADRVNTLGTAVLGLTLECARCHDHKYDPISQKNYYELGAFFANIDESGLYSHFTSNVPTPVLDLPTASQTQQIAKATAEVEALEEALSAALSNSLKGPVPEEYAVSEPIQDEIAYFKFDTQTEPNAEAPKPDLTNSIPGGPNANLSGNPSPRLVARNESNQGLELDGENGLSTSAGGDWDWWQPHTISLWVRPSQAHDRAVIWHRSRAWTDAASCGYELLLEDGKLSAALIHFWPGDAIRVRATQALPIGTWSHVSVVWDGSGHASGLHIYVDGQLAETTIVRDKLKRSIRGGGANTLTIGNRFRDRGFKGGQVDEFRIFARALTKPELKFVATGIPPVDASELSAVYAEAASKEVRSQRETLTAARQRLGTLRNSVRGIMTMQEEPGLHETFVLRRGNYELPGEKIEKPGVPESLGSIPPEIPKNRLGLAEWLTASEPDRRHPLVARVAVNRIWQRFFDRGLVATAEDFGLQGEPPSHPQLLDYLACNLIESGWDTRSIIRQLVLSDAYRRSAVCSEATRDQDPDNRWLARGPSARFNVETIRDSALAMAGQLDRTTGGPPVRPYQPAGLWKEKSGGSYQRQPGADSHRRSLYTIWKRTSPPPAMLLFDAPGREVCSAKRTTTQTPLQALVLLNDEQFVEAARGIAARVLKHSVGNSTEDCQRLVMQMLGRPASPKEISIVTRQVERQQKAFAAAPELAEGFLQIGDYQSVDLSNASGSKVPDAQLAAWTIAAQTIMNLDEWVTR